MNFLKKLKNKIKRYFTKPFKLVIPQEYAKDLQLWNNNRGVFSTSYEAICAVISQNSEKTPLFYLTSKFWNLKSVLPARFEEQKTFIESSFIPKLQKSDTLLDMGCANGEWTFIFAPFVKKIMAYDYSPALIEMGSLKQVPCSISITSPSTFSLLMSIITISDAMSSPDNVYAIVAPTLPAPMIVTLQLMFSSPSLCIFTDSSVWLFLYAPIHHDAQKSVVF